MTKHELETYRTLHHTDQDEEEVANAVVGMASFPIIRAEVSSGQPEVEGAIKGTPVVGREQHIGDEL